MGRSERRQRTKIVCVRLTVAEHHTLHTAALIRSVSLGQLIREAALRSAHRTNRQHS